MSVSLTPTMARALEIIKDRITREGIAPSVREIADGLGTRGTANVQRILVALEERGHIRRAKGGRRAIELIEPGSKRPLDVARDALVRVGADTSPQNISRIAGALCDCLRNAA